mgnify:CR=1 FL=1
MSFSPSSRAGGKMPIGKAFKSNAPTLTDLDLCYGEGSAITWLVAWVSDVYGICGFVNNEVRFRGQYAIILEVYEDTEEYLIEMEDTGDQFTIPEKDIE